MGDSVDGREWLTGEGPSHLWMCIEPEDGEPASARRRRLFVVALYRNLCPSSGTSGAGPPSRSPGGTRAG